MLGSSKSVVTFFVAVSCATTGCAVHVFSCTWFLMRVQGLGISNATWCNQSVCMLYNLVVVVGRCEAGTVASLCLACCALLSIHQQRLGIMPLCKSQNLPGLCPVLYSMADCCRSWLLFLLERKVLQHAGCKVMAAAAEGC